MTLFRVVNDSYGGEEIRERDTVTIDWADGDLTFTIETADYIDVPGGSILELRISQDELLDYLDACASTWRNDDER